jgi:hypothetical protein
MKKKLLSIVGFNAITLMAICIFMTSSASALFVPNNIIDDNTFSNSGSMSAAQIDAFLNGFQYSCISPNSGFLARVPTGYSPSGGFTFGGYQTAGSVIATAAQVYGLNPQVLIVTLEKEQNLVTGRYSSTYCAPANDNNHKYAAAAGYGCPDSTTTYSYSGLDLYQRNGVTQTSVGPTCVNTAAKAGFSQQIIRAAWLLKFGQQRSLGNTNWAVIQGSWDNSDDLSTCYAGPMTQGYRKRCPSDQNAVYYDGYTTIDSTSTHMDTGATAALYWYTPHFHGNQLFSDTFQSWFVPFAWHLTSQYAFTDSSKTTPTGLNNLAPGQRVYIGFTVVNDGSLTWSNTGPNPIAVGTTSPLDRSSPFADPTWPGPNRPAFMKETTVAPGQTATFEFWITAPLSNQGNFNEHFGLVSQGLSWLPDIGLYFGIHVQPPSYTWQLVSQYAYTDSTKSTGTGLANLEPGQRKYVGLTIKNTGNVTWSNTGPNPMDLGTTYSLDRASAFYDPTWLGYARPARMKEASVAPGQTATFEFWITAPTHSYGTFREYFDPLLEGQAWLQDIGFNYATSVVTPSYTWKLTSQYAYTDSSKTTGIGLTNLAPGQTAYIGFTAVNTGNVTWYNSGNFPTDVGTSNPYDRISLLCSGASGWYGCNRPARMKEASVAPGQTATFEFAITAPSTPGTYREYFNPVVENIAWMQSIGFNYLIVVK